MAVSLKDTLRRVLREHQLDWDDNMGFICSCLAKVEGAGPRGEGIDDWMADHQAEEVHFAALRTGLREAWREGYEAGRRAVPPGPPNPVINPYDPEVVA